MNVVKLIFSFFIQVSLSTSALAGHTVMNSTTAFPFPVEMDLFHEHHEVLYTIQQGIKLGPLKYQDSEVSQLVQQRNQDILLTFKRSIGNSGLDLAGADLKATAELALRNLIESPIAGPAALTKYDPLGEVGFCFGRATFVHLELIRLGFNPNKIGKIFALGNLNYQKRPWDFHVATFIWDQNAILVIDDTVKKIMSLEKWIKTIEKFDFDPEFPMMTIFLTDPIKFHPALGAYNKKDFSRSVYNGYFNDLVRRLSFDDYK